MYLLKVGSRGKSDQSFKYLCLFAWGYAMLRTTRVLSFVLFLLGVHSGCGLYVPDKNPLAPDAVDPTTKISSGGKYENAIVEHIFCETAVGLKKAYEDVRAPDPKLRKLAWLKEWGTAITLTITAEDQSGLSPGLSLTTPFANKIFTFPTGGNVTSPQSFNLGLGGSATANATRSETIQFTYTNAGLLNAANNFLLEQPNLDDACKFLQTGVMIDGDLKIWEFIYDKAVIAATGNASAYVSGTQHPSWPLYNTFTENITFTATFGGNATPTWKLARVSADSSSTLLSAMRTNTNQLTITMGPIQNPPTPTTPAQLKQGAQTQHDNTVLSNQIKGP
jgi:hypothetical protein